jgi:hypothetical protein
MLEIRSVGACQAAMAACSLTFNNACNLFTTETSIFSTETRVSLELQHYLKDTYMDHGGPNIRIQHIE